MLELSGACRRMSNQDQAPSEHLKVMIRLDRTPLRVTAGRFHLLSVEGGFLSGFTYSTDNSTQNATSADFGTMMVSIVVAPLGSRRCLSPSASSLRSHERWKGDIENGLHNIPPAREEKRGKLGDPSSLAHVCKTSRSESGRADLLIAVLWHVFGAVRDVDVPSGWPVSRDPQIEKFASGVNISIYGVHRSDLSFLCGDSCAAPLLQTFMG